MYPKKCVYLRMFTSVWRYINTNQKIFPLNSNYFFATSGNWKGVWQAKVMSLTAQATLIKSELSSMPTYSVFVFILSKIICKHSWPTASKTIWDIINHGKIYANLKGSRDINKALVGELVWHVLTQQGKIWVRIFYAKYLKGTSLLKALTKKNLNL